MKIRTVVDGVPAMTVYRVEVQRRGNYWALYLPKLDRHTQARSLREIDEMARDLVVAMCDVPAESVAFDVQALP